MEIVYRLSIGIGLAVVKSKTHVFECDWRRAMDAAPQIMVTLSVELLAHLRKHAQEMHVPLRWLVAGLVCDTFESGNEKCEQSQAAYTAV
jgi:hypothetical protein